MDAAYAEYGVGQNTECVYFGIDDRSPVAGHVAKALEVVSVVAQQSVFAGQPDESAIVLSQAHYTAYKCTVGELHLLEKIFFRLRFQRQRERLRRCCKTIQEEQENACKMILKGFHRFSAHRNSRQIYIFFFER